MEIPSEVLIHNELLGMKGARGRLLTIAPEGYYELNCQFGDRMHRLLLPISGTVIISSSAEQSFVGETEVER
ncbi:MAG: hypothetical protein ACM3OB_01335 [Acidobacteriota bacterium]